MNSMFKNCFSLSKLSNKEKWDYSSVKQIDDMFDKYISLSSLPDISKWNIKNLKFKPLFIYCISLSYIQS